MAPPKGTKHSVEARLKKSAAASASWRDPQVRARRLAGMRRARLRAVAGRHGEDV